MAQMLYEAVLAKALVDGAGSRVPDAALKYVLSQQSRPKTLRAARARVACVAEAARRWADWHGAQSALAPVVTFIVTGSAEDVVEFFRDGGGNLAALCVAHPAAAAIVAYAGANAFRAKAAVARCPRAMNTWIRCFPSRDACVAGLLRSGMISPVCRTWLTLCIRTLCAIVHGSGGPRSDDRVFQVLLKLAAQQGASAALAPYWRTLTTWMLGPDKNAAWPIVLQALLGWTGRDMPAVLALAVLDTLAAKLGAAVELADEDAITAWMRVIDAVTFGLPRGVYVATFGPVALKLLLGLRGSDDAIGTLGAVRRVQDTYYNTCEWLAESVAFAVTAMPRTVAQQRALQWWVVGFGGGNVDVENGVPIAPVVCEEPVLTAADIVEYFGPSCEAAADDTACVICMLDNTEEPGVVVLPCGHAHHMSCLAQWFKSAGAVCTTCRAPVLEAIYARHVLAITHQ